MHFAPSKVYLETGGFLLFFQSYDVLGIIWLSHRDGGNKLTYDALGVIWDGNFAQRGWDLTGRDSLTQEPIICLDFQVIYTL